jgi:hypothetical protein
LSRVLFPDVGYGSIYPDFFFNKKIVIFFLCGRKPEGEVVSEGAGNSSPPRSDWLVVGEGGVRSIVHSLETNR